MEGLLTHLCLGEQSHLSMIVLIQYFRAAFSMVKVLTIGEVTLKAPYQISQQMLLLVLIDTHI